MSKRIHELVAAGTLTGVEPVELSMLSATIFRTATTISFAAADNSINDSANGLITAGFAVGRSINVINSVANNIYTARIGTLTAGKMTLLSPEGDAIVDGAAGPSVTIRQWTSVRTTTQDIAGLSTGGGGGSPLTYTIDTGSTADSDPGDGLLKFNNATQSSATQLYIDNTSLDAVAMATYFASLPQTGYLTLVQTDDASKWRIYDVSMVTSASGYYKFDVSNMAGAGSFADGVSVFVAIDTDAGAGAGSIGRHMIPIMAGSMRPSLTGGCGALTGETSAANQPDILYLPFDPTTQEFAQFSMIMPKSWDEGTISAKVYWGHDATTTNFGVVWQLQAVAMGDGDVFAAAFGTEQTMTDTGGTTDAVYTSPESSPITVAGTPGAEEMVMFRIARVPANGSDTLAVDARLFGVALFINTDADTDA